MLKKPEFNPQPPETTQNPTNISLQAQAIEEKVVNNGEKTISTAPSIVGTTIQEPKEVIIRKKAQYRSFMKLIKDKKYTSAILTSRILGVDKNTITSWLETKAVRELMQSTYNSYIDDIEESKDWKAKAYLLDKLEDRDNEKQGTVNLTNLIQINTVSPSQE